MTAKTQGKINFNVSTLNMKIKVRKELNTREIPK